MGKNIVGHADECVFLAEHGAVLADEGQTVYIGVNNNAEIEAAFAHAAHDSLQVFLQRFWIMGKVAIGLAVQYLIINAKGLQQIREDDAAHAVDGIHADAEAGLADGFCIDELQGKHALDVAMVEGVVFNVFSQMVHIGILESLFLGYAKHLVAFFLVEELTLAIEQLQGIPLARIMRGGDDDAAVGTAHANGQLGGRRGGQSDVDDVVAIAHQSSANHVLHHLARDAGIAANDNLAATLLSLALRDKSGIGGYKLHDV